MRLAFFGGSFDPPHVGHLHIAQTACERLRLDRVLLAPVGRQPLKSHDAAPFADRLKMVTLLTASDPRLEASAVDAPQDGNGPNYTADTLARLRPTLPEGAELYFLAGADSFLTLPHWNRPEVLLAGDAEQGGLLNGWILAARPGFPLDSLGDALPPGYSLGAQSESEGPVLTQQVFDPAGRPATRLHLLPDLDDPATATRIRDAIRDAVQKAAGEGHEIPRLTSEIAPEIAQYIRDHRLYHVLG